MDSPHRSRHDITQVHLRTPEFDAASLETCHFEQVFNQLRQLVGRQIDIPEQPVQSRGQVLRFVGQHDANGSLDSGDWCA